jgi:hypothetical protein
MGTDLLINDVISFDIQVFDPTVYSFDFINLPPSQPTPPPGAGTTAQPYANTVYQPHIRVYDTWRLDAANVTPYDYSHSIPVTGPPGAATADGPTVMPWQAIPSGQSGAISLSYGATKLYGIQISLRIWDVKAQKTRQITLIQDT